MRKFVTVCIALAAAAGIMLLPTPPELTEQGHALLAIVACMLILWVSQVVDFSASSFFLMGLMALAGGLVEDPANPGAPLGAVGGVRLALRGFSSPGWVLVAAALFLAAAVESSGFGRRISLLLLSLVGTTPRRIRIGTLVLTLLLSLIIPSPAANAGLCTVLMLSVMQTLKVPLYSNLAKGTFLTVTFGPIFSAMMVLTAGGGPVQTAAFIYEATGRDLSWLEFALYGAPLGLGLSVGLFFLLEHLFPVRGDALPDGKLLMREALACCGPMTRMEKGIALVLAVTIPLWATSKVLHPVDNSTIAMLAVAAVFFPGLLLREGAPSWQELSERVSWGTLMLFGAVLSLGQALLQSGAAAWLARVTLVEMGVIHWPLLAIVGVGGLLFALLGLAFSARSAAIGALTPTIIGMAQSLPLERQIPVWGLTLILNYAVQFSVVFPANSPMAIIAYSSNTFTTKDMVRLSVPVMILAVLLLVVLSATWWPWLGVL